MGGGVRADRGAALELRVGGCRIVVGFGFPAVVAVACCLDRRTLVLVTLGVCLLHELGHGAALWATRAGLREVRLSAAGMRMRPRRALLTRGQALAVCLSGPAVNLLAAALLWRVRHETALLHLAMGTFNLLPYRLLDGGTALGLFLGDRGERVRRIVCMGMAGACILWMLAMHVLSPFLYAMALYLGASELGGTEEAAPV